MSSSRVSTNPPGAASIQSPSARPFDMRPGRSEDAPECGRICYEAFKTIAENHGFPPDIPSVEVATGLMSAILPNARIYSVVAESGGRIVGSNFLWQDTIAGLGPITVDPAVQNGAIGRGLMQDVLDYCDRTGFPGVRLVQSAYHNRSLSLYAKLGFVVREPLANMQGPPIQQPIPGFDVRPAGENDAEACNTLCHKIHGHARPAELRDAIAHGSAAVVVRNGRITGYTTGVGFFGHTVGESDEDLKALISASPEFAGPGFLLPARNAELFRWSLEKGLRVLQVMTLMSRGLYNEPAGAFLPSILY